MKLRFRNNSLRLRLNQREVKGLAAGLALEERVYFPDDACMRYILEPTPDPLPLASFTEGTIRVTAPEQLVRNWAENDAIGIYFELPANPAQLSVAIEKDLECVDSPVEERDSDAFPRSPAKNG